MDCISADALKVLFEKYKTSTEKILVRDLAIIILCFSGFLKYDEVSNFKVDDVMFREGYLSLKI